MHHHLGHFVCHLQPHHLAAAATFAQPLLQGLHQIIGFQVTQFQVCVAGDAEEVVTFHMHAREQQPEVECHHLLQRHGGVHRLGLFSAQLGGNLNEAGQVFLGHLHPGELLLARIRIPHQGSHVEAEVADEGEGVGGIHRQGGQHRENGVLEVGLDPLALAVVEVGVVDQVNAVAGELALQ